MVRMKQKTAIVCMMFLCGVLWAESVQLTPQNPQKGDSVEIFYKLGEHNNGCAPVYEATYQIEEQQVVCIKAPCPKHYVIYMDYKLVRQADYNEICTAVITPYGPKITLSNAQAGMYTLVVEGKKVSNFSVDGLDDNATHIEGSVIENTAPTKLRRVIEGALIYVEGNPVKESYPLQYTVLDSTRSDSDGRFSLYNISSDALRLRVEAKGYQSLTHTLDKKSSTRLVLQMLPADAHATLYVSFDPDIYPCNNCTIVAYDSECVDLQTFTSQGPLSLPAPVDCFSYEVARVPEPNAPRDCSNSDENDCAKSDEMVLPHVEFDSIPLVHNPAAFEVWVLDEHNQPLYNRSLTLHNNAEKEVVIEPLGITPVKQSGAGNAIHPIKVIRKNQTRTYLLNGAVVPGNVPVRQHLRTIRR